jgi:isocitrate dehydrogenase (NAD+)
VTAAADSYHPRRVSAIVAAMADHTVVLIAGDGIGPEVSEAVQRVLEAARAPVAFVERYAGVAALDRNMGSTLPEETVGAIRQHHVALKGPCTTPVGGGFRSVNVELRRTLDLYAAVRPVRSLEGVSTRYAGVDLVVIRENTEGLYSGVENHITDGVVVSMKVATRHACHRIAHWAFRYATRRRRQRIALLHKANIMKMTDGMLLAEARKVHQLDYPNIEYNEVIIDAAAMRLVQEPSQFDILLCENLYGDIVSDLCAGLVGGLGCTPGANIGDEDAVFEAVHGSAPDIAGRNLANPLALLMSATMMLNHLAEQTGDPECSQAAERIKVGYDCALKDGHKTRDLGGTLGTREFAQTVVDRIGT